MKNRSLRRYILAGMIAATPVAGFQLFSSSGAQAVCGGGAPGEPCYCPSGPTVTVKGKVIIGDNVQC